MADDGLISWVAEALEPIGSVTARMMMGARTLYCDSVIFAIAADGELWFKADAETNAVWDAEGAERFIYDASGDKPLTMNYRRVPGDVYDDAEAMRHWAELAIAAGARSKVKRRK